MPDVAIKRQRGCLFYGGITAIVLFVFVLLAALLGLRLVKRMLNEFTDSKPMPLPSVTLPPAEMQRLKVRVNAFEQAVHQRQATEPLALSADQINALIGSDSDLQALKGKLFVMLESNQVRGLVSVPLDQVGLPYFKGRFLNGQATLGVAFHDGFLSIMPQAITVKGKVLPGVYMDKIRKQNLAGDFNTDPRSSVALEQLQDIQIKDGRLVIVPKNETDSK